MALQIEGVVDRSVDREKALGRRRRFEALHLPLSSSRSVARSRVNVTMPAIRLMLSNSHDAIVNCRSTS